MRRSAHSLSRGVYLARRAEGASRRDLLLRLAARFEVSEVDGLDWDALRDAKRHAWPMPELVPERTERKG